MSNPNTDRDQRVRQIRERQARCMRPDRDDVPQRTADPLARELARQLRQAQTDRGYLLSLLDSQAAEIDGLKGEITFLNDKYLDREAAVAVSAATRMRDRCVAKVRELRGTWVEEAEGRTSYQPAIDYAKRDAADEIITALQSLTLEGEQEK